MKPNTEYTKRDWDSHPPYIVPDYKSTLLRGPKKPLIPLPHSLSELPARSSAMTRSVRSTTT